MKNIYKKIVCVGLCGIMAASSVAFAADSKSSGFTKDETVYVMMNADGSVKKQTVSSWIHNDNGIKGISEKVSLTDIKNVKGDQKPTLDGDNLSWDIKDNDIYYQGLSTKTPPISMKITYKLDGKEITAKDIAGKTGKVEIAIKYTNNEKSTATINGKSKQVYTPFLVTSICDLKTENFKNVKCDNAKIMSDGNNEIVTIAAFPGLKEDLGESYSLLKDVASIELADEFVITADATNFTLAPIMTGVTSNISTDSFKKSADVQKVSKGLGDFFGGVNKLDDGAKKLSEGATKLSGGVNQYTKAISDMILLLNGKLPTVEKQLNDVKAGMAGQMQKIGADMTSAQGEMMAMQKQLEGLYGKIGMYQKTGAVSMDVILSLKETADALAAELGKHGKTLTSVGATLKGVQEQTGKLSGDLTAQYSQIKAKIGPVQKELAAKSAQLNDGAKQVANGATELSKGTATFKTGTEKMASGIGNQGDASYLFAVKDVLLEKAQSYNSYSGKPEKCDSSVKFVLKTDEIKAQITDTVKKQAKVEKVGFWQRIINLFK